MHNASLHFLPIDSMQDINWILLIVQCQESTEKEEEGKKKEIERCGE